MNIEFEEKSVLDKNLRRMIGLMGFIAMIFFFLFCILEVIMVRTINSNLNSIYDKLNVISVNTGKDTYTLDELEKMGFQPLVPNGPAINNESGNTKYKMVQ